MDGAQLDIPVGATPNSHPGWNGMSIKDILEKVDLFNITTQNASDMGVKIVIIIMNKIIFIRLIDSYTCGIFFLGIQFWCITNIMYQIYRVPNN